MSLAIRNPWVDLADVTARSLPTSVGVFELADDNGGFVAVGFAGGRSTFGLRSEIPLVSSVYSTARRVRYEVTSNYLSRLGELQKLYAKEIPDVASCD